MEFTERGIWLADLDLWLDPAQECPLAWISHAHSDHACALHRRVIATPDTLELYRLRFGDAFEPVPLAPGEHRDLGSARLTAIPAGHILGAAQLLVEHGGQRLLYTGDVKLRPALGGPAGTPVECDRLITESTFGLPIFHLLSREDARDRILAFARECFSQNTVPVFLAHPLGRGQEILTVLSDAGIPSAAHGLVERYIPFYSVRGWRFDSLEPCDPALPPGRALVTVHGFRRQLEARGANARIAYVSGWAALDNARARSGAEELIPYSDHADFEELLTLVERSWARQVDVVHGYADAFARILNARGIAATGHPGVPRHSPQERA